MSDTVGPKGLGMFIWQWNSCEGGDVDKIVAKAKACGITWLAIHFYSGVWITKLKAAGLYVACWSYCVPGEAETVSWIQLATACRRAGADAILPDCEIEWESRKDENGNIHPSDRRPEAAVFAAKLREALGPYCWIGNCGAWQWPDRHPIYPDHAFGKAWSGALPERYWTMFSPSESPSTALNESEREWADKMNAGAYQAIVPIGSAFDGKAQGGQALRAEDVAAFLDRQETCALWSWQHVPPEVWVMLEERATAVSPAATTEPPPEAT